MSETEAPLLQLNGVSVVYDGHAVIDGLSLEVGRGEFVVIHGSTGCGKSTILRLFAGLIDPTEGEVVVAGDRIDEFDEAQRRWLRRSMGLMMQEELLLEDRTVLENVMLPALAADETAQEARRRALLALNKCGAADLADLRPSSLSAGSARSPVWPAPSSTVPCSSSPTSPRRTSTRRTPRRSSTFWAPSPSRASPSSPPRTSI